MNGYTQQVELFIIRCITIRFVTIFVSEEQKFRQNCHLFHLLIPKRSAHWIIQHGKENRSLDIQISMRT